MDCLVQVCEYYLAFPGDRMYMKCLVYGTSSLEFVQSILLVEGISRNFVTDFQLGVFDQVGTTWLSIPIITAIGKFACTSCRVEVLISHQDTFVVQGFYAHRISILAKSKRVAGAIAAVCY